MKNQNKLLECGDFEFYRTLFDPVRIEILKFLAINGKKNITEIAENFTQDRSVISRHLELMNRYKILNKEKLNRITLYEINSEYILEEFETTTNTLKDQIDLKDFPKLNEKQAEYFLRSRRSIRNYKTEPVSKEKLTKLIDIARLAPTAGNSQGISFIVVQNKQLLEQALDISIQMIESSPLRPLVEEAVKRYREDGYDLVFRDAPNLIIATSDKNITNGRDNAVSSLTYLELYAPSLGLGSCWAGLFEYCIAIENSPLLKLFNIPEDKKVVGAVMVGYPKYSYKRLVDRNPLDATFIE